MRLADLTWQEAERRLTPQAVVVLPIGAASKEHGPHLLLKNDLLLAEYLAGRVVDLPEVVVAPTVSFHYYPAFVEYPGSISLRLETARDLVVDICRSLARHGPRRYYALNTGVSTLRALEPAASELAQDGILLVYTDILAALAPAARQVAEQKGGSHADEIETSMMLYVAPGAVDLTKAVLDYHPSRAGGLTRDPKGPGTYSPTGAWGDPTLATREKGRVVVEALVEAVQREIEETRRAPLPEFRRVPS